MRYIILLAALILAFYLIYRRSGQPLSAQGPTVRVRDLPSILDQLRRTGQSGSFAGFIVPNRGRPDAEPLNVQFSIEDGDVGFDWLLLQQLNINDRDRFIALVNARGHTYRTLTMNGVPYVRVESGDVAALATAVLTELYGLSADDEIEWIQEGFEWPPSAESDRPGAAAQ